MLTDEEKYGLCTPLCQTPVSELLAFAAHLLPAGHSEEKTGKCKTLECLAKHSSKISLLQKEIMLLSSNVCDSGKSEDCNDDENNVCAVTGEEVFSQSEELKELEMSTDHSDYKTIHTDAGGVSECGHTESNCYTAVSAEAKALSELPNQMQAATIHSCGNNTKQISSYYQQLGHISLCVSQAPSDTTTPSPSFESRNCNKSFTVQNSEMVRKPESTKRSRIAARFDISPNSASCS